MNKREAKIAALEIANIVILEALDRGRIYDIHSYDDGFKVERELIALRESVLNRADRLIENKKREKE